MAWGSALGFVWPVVAQPYRISGYIEDAESGERIPGANLYLESK